MISDHINNCWLLDGDKRRISYVKAKSVGIHECNEILLIQHYLPDGSEAESKITSVFALGGTLVFPDRKSIQAEIDERKLNLRLPEEIY